MRLTVICLHVLALLIVLGCGSDDTTSPYPKSDLVFTSTVKDEKPEQDPSFVDIVEATIKSSTREILLKIRLRELPAEFTYAQSEVQNQLFQYAWRGVFDIDSNGFGANDISLALLYSKPPGAVESRGPLLTFCQCNLWEFTSGGARVVGDARVTVSGNVITLAVSRGAHASLESVQDSTRVDFSAYYTDGIIVARDSVAIP